MAEDCEAVELDLDTIRALEAQAELDRQLMGYYVKLRREDYPQIRPTTMAGSPLTWRSLVEGLCKQGIFHHECGCPLDEVQNSP